MRIHRAISRACSVLLPLLALVSATASGQTGRELMEESLRRHALPPSVYQEQTMILSDGLGQHTVRTLRFYAKHDANGTRRLLVIRTPEELRGMGVLVTLDAKSGARHGPPLSGPLFGSNLTIADLEDERPADFTYEQEETQDLDRVTHYVLKAVPVNEEIARATGYGVRRIFLRKDNLFVSRVDYLDRQGQLARRLTFRDIRPDEAGAWRAGMILMEDLREDRRTLIKVDRRVHSADYVPEGVFKNTIGETRGQARVETRGEPRAHLRAGTR